MSAKGQVRSNEASSKETSEERVSPLFARNEPPIPADHIAEIKLQRLVGKDRHVDLPMSDFYIDGDPEDIFVIDPYEVDEQDLQAQFGGGDYWIEVRRKPDGSLWKGSGRRLVLGGPPKNEGKVDMPHEDENQDDDEDENEPNAVPSAASDSADPRLFELLRDQMKQTQNQTAREAQMARDHARTAVDMYREFSSSILGVTQGKDKGSSDEIVRLLRDENEAIRSRSRQDIEDLRRSHHSELDKKDRQHEDDRRSDKQRVEREIDDLRRRSQVQEDELRRRWTDDTAEQRSRYDRDITQMRGELIDLRTKLQGDHDRSRLEYEQRIRTLERENIELEKRANSIQAELDAVQNAPPGGPTMTDRLIAIAQTPVGEAMLRQVLGAAMASATPTPAAAIPQGAIGYQNAASMPSAAGAGPMNPDGSLSGSPSGSPLVPRPLPFTPSAAVPAPWMHPAQPAMAEMPISAATIGGTQPVPPVSNGPSAETQPVARSAEASTTQVPPVPSLNGAAHVSGLGESKP